MALGKYITIDNAQIPNPNPGTFSDNYPPDENVFTSEAGTQMSVVVRLDRYTWSASFNCTSTMKDYLISKCQQSQCSCSINNGAAMNGRLRYGGSSLVEDSENTAGTDGLWVVNLTFEEF